MVRPSKEPESNVEPGIIFQNMPEPTVAASKLRVTLNLGSSYTFVSLCANSTAFSVLQVLPSVLHAK